MNDLLNADEGISISMHACISYEQNNSITVSICLLYLHIMHNKKIKKKVEFTFACNQK